MNYEEKYNEILEWARKNKARLNGVPIEEVLPELAESEDERIRKRLIEYFEGFRIGNAKVKWEGLTVQDVLDWLEKQKEQKPANLSEMMVHKEPYIAPVPTPMVADEQKPWEWSEEDEKYLNRVINLWVNDFGEDSDTVKWLKSLRPSWKPSEVHLSALLAIFNDPDNIGSQTCQLALTDLYEQLKKL